MNVISMGVIMVEIFIGLSGWLYGGFPVGLSLRVIISIFKKIW
jgi:hypothetical protein